jgi:integrase
MSPRRQDGSLFVIGDTCYVKYRTTENGKRVHKTVKLCEKSERFTWWKKQKNGKSRWGFSAAVHDRRDEVMRDLRAKMQIEHSALSADMRILDFWEQRYLPYCEEIAPLTGKTRKRTSTLRGYKQIWNQHLRSHFGDLTLREYEPRMGTRFLRSLTSTQGKTTLKHIKALCTALFNHAIEDEIIQLSPWREVKIPKDAIEPKRTEHYTLEEAENMISALADHVDCQLVLALSCFLGLRPGEIAALRWEDFDSDSVHIRRSVVRGTVGAPKTPESIRLIPFAGDSDGQKWEVSAITIPLQQWRLQCGKPREGYVFESRNDTPVNLHNLIARVITPHVNGGRECVRCASVPKASQVKWKGLYAGRRGACTLIIEKTNGNYAVAQALLGHKAMTTTLNVYKKQISDEAFKTGMETLAGAMRANALGAGSKE